MKIIPLTDDCCPRLLEEAPSPEEAAQVADTLKALADPARVRLVGLIAARGEACVCDLTAPLDLAQPTVSHHLRLLHDAGLVAREQRGRWAYYRLVPERFRVLRALLSPTAPT